jgi:hypothetical protein
MASKAVQDLVILLGETYRQSVSKVTIEAYAVGLEGLTDQQILAAGKRAIQTNKFMPTPSELRELAGQGNGARSIAAWADLLRAEGKGSYRHVDFEDPLINATIRMLGGWPAMFVRRDSIDGDKWYRIDFVRIYESLAAAGVDGEMCRPLPGLGMAQVRNGEVVDAIPDVIECDPVRRKESQALIRGPITSRPSIGSAARLPSVEFHKA